MEKAKRFVLEQPKYISAKEEKAAIEAVNLIF